jgi:hypothetical protein
MNKIPKLSRDARIRLGFTYLIVCSPHITTGSIFSQIICFIVVIIGTYLIFKDEK